MKPTWRFALVAIGALAVMLGVDLAYLKWGYPKQAVAGGYLCLAILYATFVWAAWPMFPRRSRIERGLLRSGTGLLALAGWYLPSMFAMYSFHLRVGGN